MNKKNEIIVIGAGVAGLTAGIYALKLGYHVHLFEKNPTPGGECTGWDRQGCHIDNCIHWLIGTTPGTDLNKLYKETRLLDEEAGVYRFPLMYTSYLDGKHISLYPDIEKTRQEWEALSPEDTPLIDDLMEDVRKGQKTIIPAGIPNEMLGAFSGISLLLKSRNLFALSKKYQGMSIQDLKDRFHHPLIKACISDFCPSESKGENFAVMYGNFASGDGGVPVGGSRQAAMRMKRRFEELGGIYHGSSPVTRIIVEDGKARGVSLSNGSFMPADYFIPACDADFTFSQLLDKRFMPEKIREYFDNPQTYVIYGMVQAAWMVDSPQNAISTEIILDVPELRVEPWLNDRITLKCYDYEPSFAPQGKHVVQLLWGCDHSSWDYWKNLDEKTYRAKKQELASLVEKKIEKTWPQWEGRLTLLDTWTSRTYRTWCNAHDGYNQACIMTKNTNMMKDYPPPYLKGLSNVVLAGQWMSPPGGIPGSCISGKFAAYRVDHLAHKVRDAAKKTFFRGVLPAMVVFFVFSRLC